MGGAMTEQSQAAPQPAAQQPYAWGFWLLGMLLTLCVGAILNVVAGMIALSVKGGVPGFFIGLAPGAIAIGLAMLKRRSAFAHGVIVAGCIIALIGGICGASMTSMDFR